MSKEVWAAVDAYLGNTVIRQSPALEAALTDSKKAGLPSINVSPAQGKFLHILAKSLRARKILEVGTLGGYSTIWLASALPKGGKLISLELERRHAEIATKNLKRARLAHSVEIRVGKAIDSLPGLVADSQGPFDLVFLDADKKGNPDYFEWALKLSREGTVILVDNVVRDGAVIDASSKDESVQGVRRLNEVISHEKRVLATTLQTVGVKGYDGFTMALVLRL